MSKPLALDLFCGAGGASMGIHRAGFDVTGIDLRPQPRYPFKFIQGEAMDATLTGFDFVWASPPCQAYTRMSKGLLQSQGRAKEHPKLIEQCRAKLKTGTTFWVMENVVGAPLYNPLMLCGSSFGLLVQRHRLFECSHLLFNLDCRHAAQGGNYPPPSPFAGEIQGCRLLRKRTR